MTAENVHQMFEDAEEVLDPLDGLVERAATDPGVAFQPDVLAALIDLARADRAAFESLRAALKRAGVRVGALDGAMATQSEDGDRKPTQADRLIELAEAAGLFHTPDQTGYTDLEINGHRETWPIRSRGFRRWLARRYFEEDGGAPSSEALASAMNVIEAKAAFDGPEQKVCLRVGSHDGKLYLDLADPAWRAIEIAPDGWTVVDAPPVRFRRSAGMLALPAPERGGSIDAMRQFLNLKTDADFVLATAWLLAAFRDAGPYPALALAGEQGSAKSTFAAVLRRLVDPNTAPLRALPKEDRDLFIAASNGHVLAFDNVSGLPSWISDTLCRLATGGGFAVRQLYSDTDEVLFDACRPVILNGIEDIVGRPDLADRSIFLTLEPIPDEARKAEAELWAAFDAERPRILGALLDAVATGLRRLPETKLDRLPRLADFALWASACETEENAGKFWRAWCGNRDDAVETILENDPVATAVRALIAGLTVGADGRTAVTGNSTFLLGALAQVAGDAVAKAKEWPKTPSALSGRLRRAATFLRKVGVVVEFTRDKKARVITLSLAAEDEGKSPSPASPASPEHKETNNSNGFDDHDGVTANGAGPSPGASSPPPGASSPSSGDAPAAAGDGDDAEAVTPNHLKNNEGDGGDGDDDVSPSSSATEEDWEADL